MSKYTKQTKKHNKYKTLDVLIVASSDMANPGDYINHPEDIINITFPCKNYTKSAIKLERDRNQSKQRCSHCHYTEIEHEYGYPMFPISSNKIEEHKVDGTPFDIFLHYSDLWINKQEIFRLLSKSNQGKINIRYQTCNPQYTLNMDYLPTIEKINEIIRHNLGIKGYIKYDQPYLFDCGVEKVHQHPKYDGRKYDIIFVVSAGLGWVYKPHIFNKMSGLVNKGGAIAHISYIDNPLMEVKYHQQMTITHPLTFSLNLYDPKDKENSKDRLESILNYYKIMKSGQFTQVNNGLIKLK